MEKSEQWPVVEEKIKELRSLTDEQWEMGGWELAALGERTLRTIVDSKWATGYLRDQAEMLQTTVDSFLQSRR